VTEYKQNGTVIQYTYDANQVRVQKLVGSIPTYYIAGADGKTEVIATSTQTAPTYTTWAGVQNVGQVKRNGATLTRYYYVKDHLGNTRMTVASTGTVDSYFDYYPFGQLMDGRTSVASADSRYEYTGKERDAESGYDYFGARYYAARIGRWLSVDPLAQKSAHLTVYGYVGEDPLSETDPDGQQWYRDQSGMMQFSPFVYGQDNLEEGNAYIGSTYHEDTENGEVWYRNDGSIVYSNQTDAYHRANSITSKEEMVIVTASGTIVTPDYENTSTDCTPDKYNYTLEGGKLEDPLSGRALDIITHLHTHFDLTGDPNPSFFTYEGTPGDVGFAGTYTPNKMAFVMGFNGILYYYVANKESYRMGDFREFVPGVDVKRLLNGYDLASYVKAHNWRWKK
jgi:RHS repeat-associated protein